MGSKGLMSAIMCVLILGLILEQVQVEGKSCCKSTTARNCYNICRLKGSPPLCAAVCDCIIIKKDKKCPKDYPKLDLRPNDSGEPDAIEYCNLGCTSSVCDYMNTGKFIYRLISVVCRKTKNIYLNPSCTILASGLVGEVMKIDMESCSDACKRFCSGDAHFASVDA
ncbi:unnamed protein product [Urochloa decumbens]|uniref:Acidic protein n=1 Tax=Urochloa decumbens TaxID=240449 RepID=A0ABC9C961_9POAL